MMWIQIGHYNADPTGCHNTDKTSVSDPDASSPDSDPAKHFMLKTDLDPIRIKGFDYKKWKIFTAENFYLYFFDQKLLLTYL